jgi:4-hydroxy-3-polyprenylbenzoate decarboxylase
MAEDDHPQTRAIDGRDEESLKRLRDIGDLRGWLALMEDIGELRTVRSADWDLEIGAICELNYKQADPPALVFDDIKGYATGRRVVAASVSTARRLGIALRIGMNETDAGLVEALREAPGRWARTARDYPTRTVPRGPVQENVVPAEQIDLRAFPAPRWHEFDGGRYLGTGCIVFTSDPETGRVNGGAYRIQIQNEGRGATISIVAGKHGAQNVEAWFAKEGRAPVTVSFGQDPLMLIVGGTDVPAGTSELEYAGAVIGAPVDVVLADNGLPIPAGSELAVEGWLEPDQLAPEGPFGEWTGYYSKTEKSAYLLQMSRLYHRDDPIILGAPPGVPPHDYSYMRSAMKSAMVLDALNRSGVPGVEQVWAHEAGGGRLLLAVSIDQRYPGHSRQVGYLTSQDPAGVYMNRYVVVVDADVDVRDLNELMWAVCTRSDPEQDIDILRQTWGSGANPLHVPGTPAYMSRAIIDACVPFERRSAFPRVARTDPAVLREVRAKWRELFGGQP